MIAFNKNKKKIAFIASYLPRKCGIATFTSDLINNTKLAAGEEFEAQVFAMQSTDELPYHKPVKLAKHSRISFGFKK